jgi:ATP-dependent Clp protease ATP-binding subunit ClpA
MNFNIQGTVIPIALTVEEVERRLTSRAATVFDEGYKLARKRHHHDFTSAHLLAGLALLGEKLQGKSFAGDALIKSGITPKNLLALPQFLPMTIIPAGNLITTSARRVLTIAFWESSRLNHHVVTEDHVLLGITRGQDEPGVSLFHVIGVDPDMVTQRIMDIIPEQTNSTYVQ